MSRTASENPYASPAAEPSPAAEHRPAPRVSAGPMAFVCFALGAAVAGGLVGLCAALLNPPASDTTSSGFAIHALGQFIGFIFFAGTPATAVSAIVTPLLWLLSQRVAINRWAFAAGGAAVGLATGVYLSFITYVPWVDPIYRLVEVAVIPGGALGGWIAGVRAESSRKAV